MRKMSDAYQVPDYFETERYSCRRPLLSFAPIIFSTYGTDPEVTRFLGWPMHTDVQQTRIFLEAVERDWRSGTAFAPVIVSRSQPHRLIGMIRIGISDHIASYGYVIRRDYWGQGCVPEVLSALMAHALAHPKISRAQAFCDVENHASIRVLEKVGMAREGLLRRWFLHPNISDVPRDCIMFAKTR